MKKLRSPLAAIALAVTLIGSAFLGLGAASLATVASSQHTSSVSTASVAGKTAGSITLRPLVWCPVIGMDC